jgi:CubicO group peptidase (beta-lactamase class C family)
VDEDWRRKGIATALFEESREFADNKGFTMLTLGTKKGSDACYFYDSLCPSTKDSNAQLDKYTWFLSKGLSATRTAKGKRGPRHHKPHNILMHAAPELERLAKTGGAELAMACVVTSKKATFWSNQGTSRHLNPNQVVFPIASLTKIFTKMALELCVGKKLLTWDDPISKHLSIDPESDLGRKSIFQVAFHSFMPYMNDAILAPDASPILCMEDLLPVAQNYHRESKGIQTSLEYSNANFAFLADCIEQVTGKPFPIVVKGDILTPLGMNSTCVTKDDLDQIPQHRRPRDPYMRYFDKVCGPAFGFWSTVEDLAKLFKAMLAPKQSKLITWFKRNHQLDVDLFSPATDFEGLTYSLFGTGFPPDTDFGWESRNSQFSPAAERDRTNFYPKPLQCFTGAVNGFDSSAFFLPDIETVIFCAASTKNLVDVAYPIAVRLLQELLPDPISPDMAQITLETKRYQEIAMSRDLHPACLPPLSGSFVCDELRQWFDFEENEYRVTLSGRVVLEYQWVHTKDAVKLVPSPPYLEWVKSWENNLLQVTREDEGDVTGLIRMGWNGTMRKYKRKMSCKIAKIDDSVAHQSELADGG